MERYNKGLKREKQQGTKQILTCDKVHFTWLHGLFLSQTEQKVKSYGVEWGQRVELCKVHLALRSSTGSILDVLGMVYGYFKLKEKNTWKGCYVTTLLSRLNLVTRLTIPHNVLGVINNIR